MNRNGVEATALGLAFIEAQKKQSKEQEQKMETMGNVAIANTTLAVDNRPQIQRIWEYLNEEGEPRNVWQIAKALNIGNQSVSAAMFQMTKKGMTRDIRKLGEVIQWEAVPGDWTWGSSRGKRGPYVKKGGKIIERHFHTSKPQTSQVVTPQVMRAMPAPNGVKITVQTDEGPLVMGVKQARAVYKELSALFSGLAAGFDD